MSTFRATVYVPLAELTHQNSQLLDVYAENQLFGETVLDEKAMDKNWNFVAAPLRDAGLYSEGLQVVSALRKLNLKPSFWAVYQRVKKYAWLDNQRLHAGNHHIENCEGNSAQLGLAIALLLNASASPIRYAIATGSLSLDKHKDFDIAIAAVANVPEKLDLLIEKRQANALPDLPLYCFTPTHYKFQGELHPVVDLAQVKQLAALNITVKPIAWLSEAVKLLKADSTRCLKQDKWANGILGVMGSVCAAALLYRTWVYYPIPIKILAGKHLAEPFLVCTNRDNSAVSYNDLARDGSTPIMPLFAAENSAYNVGIGWIVQPEKTPFSQQYYVAFIHLGEQTGYKLIAKQPDNAADITVVANEVLKWYWPMQETAAKQIMY
ncbi:MAG: hypothetical protein HOP02_07575 [Methylococcaceae bacterium]|nr:hypothetical protein [Methylococcaceae bacterium]